MTKPDWTLRQELDRQLSVLRAGGKLDKNSDKIRDHLMREEIAALHREIGALQRAAGLPYLTPVK